MGRVQAQRFLNLDPLAEADSADLIELTGGQIAVATLDTLYQDLPDDDIRRAYRHLALWDGTALTPALTAAMLGTGPDNARQVLDTLDQHGLLSACGQDRWEMPAPTQDHGRHLALDHDSSREREAILTDAVTYYLMAGVAADRTLMPHRRRVAAAYGSADTAMFATRQAAMAWLHAEADAVVTAQRTALELGLPAMAWQFTEALWAFVLYTADFATWETTCQLGLRAAYACQDLIAQSRLHGLAGTLARRKGDAGDADYHHGESLHLARRAGDLDLQASAHEHSGVWLLEQGRAREALTVLAEGLQLHESLNHPRARALILRAQGRAQTALGDHPAALASLTEADAVFTDLDDDYLRGQVRVDLATLLRDQGHGEQGITFLTDAINLLAQAPLACAHAYEVAAAIHHDNGQTAIAQDVLDHAIACYQQLGLRDDHPALRRTRALAEQITPSTT